MRAAVGRRFMIHVKENGRVPVESDYCRPFSTLLNLFFLLNFCFLSLCLPI